MFAPVAEVSHLGDDLETAVRAALTRLAAQLAPDRRLALCEFRPRVDGRRVLLCGVVNDPSFRLQALEAADAVPGVAEVDDWLTLLPAPDLAPWPWFVPRAAVVDLWHQPGGRERVDQALLGTPLRPLRVDGDWLQVQAPDGLISWAARPLLVPLAAATVRLWEYGPWVRVRQDTDLDNGGAVLAGTCLPLAAAAGDGLHLRWPGGGEAVLPAAAGQLLSGLPYPLRPGRSTGAAAYPAPEAITATARALLGTAFLPGGAAPGGFDAAGLIRYVFACHGVALPRAADQQWAAVHRLGPTSDPLPADLVFFGRGGAPPDAVGLYLGDGRCLLAGAGGVGLVSFHPGEVGFDPDLAAAALGYGRVLPPQGLWGEGI